MNGMEKNLMGLCKCGFTRDEEKNCDGSHKVVKAVREDIANKIELIAIEDSKTNALGMRIQAVTIAKG
jgi:CDGSH-type Zn-finger protein